MKLLATRMVIALLAAALQCHGLNFAGPEVAWADPPSKQQSEANHPWRVLDPCIGPNLRPGWKLTEDDAAASERKAALDMYPVPVGTLAMNRFRIHGWADRMEFSHDAGLLLSLSKSSPVYSFQSSLWRIDDGAYVPQAFGVPPSALTFSPDGSLVAVDHEGSEAKGKGILIVRAKTAETLCTLTNSIGLSRVDKMPRLVDISANNAVVAASSSGKVTAWSVTTGQRLCEVEPANNAFRLSSDGTKLAVFDKQQRLKVLDISKNKPLCEIDGTFTQDWDFSPDGRTITLQKTDEVKQFAAMWLDVRDTATGEQVATIKDRCIDRFVYHHDSQSILTVDGLYSVSGERGKLGWHDLRSGKPIHQRPAGATVAYCMAMSTTQPILAFNTTEGCEVWDLTRGERRMATRLRSPAVSLKFDWTNSLLAVSDRREQIHILRISEGAEPVKSEGHAGGVEAAAFSADGRRLATGGNDLTVRLWDVASCREIAILDSEELSHVVSISRTSDPNIWIVLDSAGKIFRWNSANGEVSQTKLARSAGANRGNLSADGSLVATKEPDVLNFIPTGSSTLEVCATNTGAFVQTVRGVYASAFSPDSTTIAAALRNEVVLINLKSRTMVRGPLAPDSPATAITFSPDGRSLALADRKQIHFFGVRELRSVGAIPADELGVGALSFTPDGRTLVVAGVDSVSTWDVATKRELSRQGTPRRAWGDAEGWTDKRKAQLFSPMIEGADYFLKLWTLNVLEEITLAISPDGTFAVTNSSHLAPLYWPIGRAKP